MTNYVNVVKPSLVSTAITTALDISLNAAQVATVTGFTIFN